MFARARVGLVNLEGRSHAADTPPPPEKYPLYCNTKMVVAADCSAWSMDLAAAIPNRTINNTVLFMVLFGVSAARFMDQALQSAATIYHFSITIIIAGIFRQL